MMQNEGLKAPMQIINSCKQALEHAGNMLIIGSVPANVSPVLRSMMHAKSALYDAAEHLRVIDKQMQEKK